MPGVLLETHNLETNIIRLIVCFIFILRKELLILSSIFKEHFSILVYKFFELAIIRNDVEHIFNVVNYI